MKQHRSTIPDMFCRTHRQFIQPNAEPRPFHQAEAGLREAAPLPGPRVNNQTGRPHARSGATARTPHARVAARRVLGRNTPRALLILAVCLSMTATGMAKEGAIQCANLIYGGMHTSRCFSDEFLSAVQRETTIATERRFKTVKLDSDELFNYPFVMMTGEADFMFTARERDNLKRYLESGGFLLASAGCSSTTWDRAFRRELCAIFGDDALQRIPMDHALFRTVSVIDEIQLSHPAEPAHLDGMELNGKIVVIYSPHGLNNTEYTEGCCCCGGNEIKNAKELNMNILVYALMH